MKKLKNAPLVMMVFTLIIGGLVTAQDTTNPSAAVVTTSGASIEASCRVKAKDIAANTYRTCVADQKNAQIEQIKKEYQKKLAALKSHYEAELKKISANKEMAKTETAKVDVRPVAKKSESVSEMTVELKAAPAGTMIDANGELPEPIPVEMSQEASK